MSLNFITLYAAQLDRIIDIYAALGLSFKIEQHGNGPVHFSYSTRDIIIEIYPAGEHAAAESIMLGFTVKNLKSVKDLLLERGVTVLKDIDIANGTTRMILQDMDGRRIFISEDAARAGSPDGH